MLYICYNTVLALSSPCKKTTFNNQRFIFYKKNKILDSPTPNHALQALFFGLESISYQTLWKTTALR